MYVPFLDASRNNTMFPNGVCDIYWESGKIERGPRRSFQSSGYRSLVERRSSSLAGIFQNSQSELANAVAGPQTGEEWGWCHKTCFMTLSYIKNYLYFCSIIKRCSVIQVQKSEDTSLLSCQLQFCSVMRMEFCSIRAFVRSWIMDSRRIKIEIFIYYFIYLLYHFYMDFIYKIIILFIFLYRMFFSRALTRG